MIQVRDLRFSYGGEEILKGMSFDIEDDTVTSILGPNGTGKTTFLKCLCGLNRPSSGSIVIDGKNITDIRGRELAKKIAFVPQSVPTSRMSVFDTVLLGRKPYIEWSASDEDITKVSDILDQLNMSDLALKNTGEISGGEFQKAQIARAIVQEPSIIVLDEPTNNLDISNQHRTMHMIMDAAKSRGMGAVMTMHDINLAVHYSDRFLFFKDGEVAAYGGVDVITEDLIRDVYGMEVEIVDHRGVPLVVPKASGRYEHLHTHHHPHDIHDHLGS